MDKYFKLRDKILKKAGDKKKALVIRLGAFG